ncbi:unnamed protein product [Polarella glacialis]|nr:unnamed protein product [Polarella glacialis]
MAAVWGRPTRDAKAGESAGETRARQLLGHSQLASLVPTPARLFFDENSCAHLELNELATQDSLEAAVATLHNMAHIRKNVSAIVMHLEGSPGPANLHSYALCSGNFLVGLRSVGVPLILACWGKIAGPSWSLALACDYRIAANDTMFILPVIAPPECLGDLVGQAVAAELCLGTGTMSAQIMQEMGIFQQCRPGREETQKAASEMAKRIAGFPSLACKQTMSLLSVPAVKYTAVGAFKMPD